VKNAHIVEGIFLKRHFEGYKGEDRALDKFEEANLPYEADSSPGDDDELFREYLLKLVLEIVHLIRRQKNQAAR